MAVKFKSYQEAPNKPEQDLPNDAKVSRGSILNFTVAIELVLEKLAHHDKLHAITVAPHLLDVIARFRSRLYEPAGIEVGEKALAPDEGCCHLSRPDSDRKHLELC